MNVVSRAWLKLRYGNKSTQTLVKHNTGYIRRIILISRYPGRSYQEVVEEHFGSDWTNDPHWSLRNFLGLHRKGRLPLGEGAFEKQVKRLILTDHASKRLVIRPTEDIERFLDDKYSPLWRTLPFTKIVNTSKQLS